MPKIPLKCGILGIKRSDFFFQLTDFVPNAKTPSRISECFFKLISFHAKITSDAAEDPELKLPGLRQTPKVSLQPNYRIAGGLKPLAFLSTPLRRQTKHQRSWDAPQSHSSSVAYFAVC